MTPSPTQEQTPTLDVLLDKFALDDSVLSFAYSYENEARARTSRAAVHEHFRVVEDKNQWQPIETAPKGRNIVLASIRDFMIATVYWSTSLQTWMNATVGIDIPLRIDEQPTHWMPLPAPPTDELSRTKETAE